MGNRVSTSASPFSLEDLEELARSPSLFDTLSNDAAHSAGSGANIFLRKEVKAEVERQYAEYDTSLHALRCVLDRRGTRHHLCFHRTGAETAPSGGTPRVISGQGRCEEPASNSHPSSGASTTTSGSGPTHESPRSSREYRATCHSNANEVADNAEAALPATAPADPSATNPNEERLPQRRPSSRRERLAGSASMEMPLSPRSWLFREVSVQPVDLTRRTEVRATEVYVLVIVQRTTMLGTPTMGTSPATPCISVTSARAATSPLPAPAAVAAGGAARPVANSAATSATASTEWPRDMIQLFTPRGLTTPFSSDMTRPALAYNSHSSSAGYWCSPSATPRTNGSTSGRLTPRNTAAAAAAGHGIEFGGVSQASPRSVSSQATPRASGFHFSVHLLTGKQADAMAAAAGLFTARAIEKLFLDCAEFGRRLFHNFNAAKVDAVIRTYDMPSALDPTYGRRGGSHNVNAARGSPHKSSMAPPSASGGGTTSAVMTNSVSSGIGALNLPLEHLSSALEAVKELRRELLAITRPASVAVPLLRFDKRSSAAATVAASPMKSDAHGGVVGSASDHGTPTVVSSNPAELYSLNAVYRVLNGVRVGTPRWMHTGEAVSSMTSVRHSVLGSTSAATSGGPSAGAALLGTGSGRSDSVLSIRTPRRGPRGDGAAAGTTNTSGITALIPPLNISSWLQGPQPLDLQRAAPAAAAAVSPTVSAQPAVITSTTPRPGRPPRPAWTPHSASTPPPQPLPLPTLALGVPSGDRRAGSTDPLDTASTPLHLPTVATPASETLVFSLPLKSLRSAAPAANAYARSTPRSASAEQGITNAPALTPPVAVAPRRKPLFHTLEKGKGEEAEQRTSDPFLTADAPSLPLDEEDDAQPDGHPAARSLYHTWRRHHHASGSDQDRDGIASLHDVGVEGATLGSNEAARAPPPDNEFNEVYTQQERAQRLKASQPEVTEVLPYLFVGGEDAARDRAQLLRKGITHVVNTVSWCIDSFYPDLFRYLTLSLSDAADEPIFSLFAVVNAFIEDALEKHQGRVFVHCQQGVSRSCTFVIAYIMWKQGLCYDRAYELVRARRNVCNPNLGFFMNLRLWEAQLSTPLLNSVFAYAPYTSTSPMPFSYQLTAYFDCATSCTVAGTATSRSSMPSSPTSLSSAEGRPPGFLSPRDKEVHQLLRSDVLTRATDMSVAPPAHPSTLSLDPRLGYLFLFAPSARAAGETMRTDSSHTDARRTKRKGQQRPRLSRSTDVGPGISGDEDANVVTGCVVMGSQCLSKAYSERALTACRQLLRFSFYHGEARTSVTNTGRAVHFDPMRQVRLLPVVSTAWLPRFSSLSSIPAAAVSVEVAQRLLSTRVSSPVRIRFARQARWDSCFSNVRLGAMLSHCIAEEDRLDSSEAVRRRAREGAEKGIGALSGSSVAADRQRSVRGRVSLLPDNLPLLNPSVSRLPSFRTGWHTPRTPRQLHVVPFGNGSSRWRGCETDRRASVEAASSPSVGASASQRRSHVGSAPAAAAVAAAASVPKPAASQTQRVSLLSLASSAATARTPTMGDAGGASIPLQGVPGLPLAAPAASASHNGDGPEHVAVRLAEGESFAYAYPFTASMKVSISDLEDLEEDQCYVLGFQQRTGTSVYLWCGADAAQSSADVIDAFVRQMLRTIEPAEQTAKAESLEAGEWISCSINFPRSDDEDPNTAGAACGANAATEVLADVRVLYVEQGDEPKELFTLL
ncbi:hypothetical protein LSCM1_03534 [Leishmania martiniquensis]|uniref:Dual specificity protein phosphatase n=1 Tax=Leishmania martiniquensis TaxID=1580590 RepID=A0A836KRD6_9TRYP|nr:hypothetical protein LSCM1_03534 [Leishmania martiniquensis]